MYVILIVGSRNKKGVKMQKRGRPKKTLKISPSNVLYLVPDSVVIPNEPISSDAVTNNCDTPHCGNMPEVFAKFCKSCAQDHRL